MRAYRRNLRLKLLAVARATQLHLLTELDEETRTAVCSQCGPVSIKWKGVIRGTPRWACYVAWSARNKRRSSRQSSTGRRQNRYRKNLALGCQAEGCTAVIVDPCQLDIHHLDGDRHNNDPMNLLTLCANCHRLKHRAMKRARAEIEKARSAA